jgi:hypothetical protein
VLSLFAEADPKYDVRTNIQAWTDDGEVIAVVYQIQETTNAAGERVGINNQAIFIGRPMQAMRKLAAGSSNTSGVELSSRRHLALNIDHRNMILDVDTVKEVAELPGDPWRIGSWSADGQYLTMSSYERGGCDDNHLAIWSFATHSLTEIDGQHGSWSNSGHNLAYARRLGVPPDPDDCVPDDEVRIRAADTSMDESVGKGRGNLSEARLFHVYEGPPLPEGRRSLAYEVQFQSLEKTLTDAEVADARKRIIRRLQHEFGAELRGG